MPESGAGCVTIVNKEGKKVRSFGTRGMKEGQFMGLKGVAISTDGHILAVDNHRLRKLTFDGPSSVTVSNDLVYVSEACNHRVSIFDTKGKFLYCFSKRGSGEGELDYPHGIATDAMDINLYVSDTSNNRIVLF